MSLLLYAITPARELPVAATGLDGRRLRAIPHDDLIAIVGDCDTAPQPDIAHLWAYHEAVMRLMDDGPLLPARFGSTAADEREIEALLHERCDEWHASLARVGNRVEYAVSPPDDDDDDEAGTPASGTDYMRRLLTREQRDRELEALAGPLVQDSRRTAHGIAYLVERDAAGAFVAQAGAAGLTAVGPWPPYSFASAA